MRGEGGKEVVLGAGVAGALVLAGLALALLLRPSGDVPVRASRPPPGGVERIETVRPGGGLGSAVAAFGDRWVEDRSDDRLLRMRAPEGRVVAQVPLAGRALLAAGAGGVWALQSNRGFGPYLRGPLLHVDPRTNRIRRRIALRAPSGEQVLGKGVVVQGGRVWVWSRRDILRVDPRTDRVDRRIRVAADVHGDVAGVVQRGRRLIAATADGSFLWVDARTGAWRRTVHSPLVAPVIRTSVGSRLIVTSRGSLAAVDPATGRVAWTRRLGFLVGAVTRAQGLLWVHSAAIDEPGDRLSGFDPATGEVPTTSILPAFGTTGLAALRGRLFLPTADGRLLMVTPLLL
jgi:outer membrane protein assembly factor BamB